MIFSAVLNGQLHVIKKLKCSGVDVTGIVDLYGVGRDVTMQYSVHVYISNEMCLHAIKRIVV